MRCAAAEVVLHVLYVAVDVAAVLVVFVVVVEMVVITKTKFIMTS